MPTHTRLPTNEVNGHPIRAAQSTTLITPGFCLWVLYMFMWWLQVGTIGFHVHLHAPFNCPFTARLNISTKLKLKQSTPSILRDSIKL